MSDAPSQDVLPSSALGGLLPATDWLRRYSPAALGADAVAGITLAAYLLPAAIGDASLARLPPESGLYACMFSGMVFWCFCASRHTAITVTSAISLLMGTTLGSLEGVEPDRFAALAACTALLVAGMAFLAWLIRAGSLVNFVSETVLIGFKVGVALTLASTQLPKLFGISGAHGNFWECSGHFLTHLREANPSSLIIGLGALAVLLAGRAFPKNRPVSLIVVVGGILAAGMMNLDARGVKLLGEVPQGLPRIGVPAVTWSDLNELLPLAMACFLLGAVETTAIGRMFASKHGGRLDANREFLALAAVNLAAGLGRGMPVSGGMSQSLVNEGARARTPLSGLIAALMILIVAVFFSGALRNLPQPALAAIVLMAIPGLVKVSALKRLWRTDRQELAIAGIALAGVLASGLLRGVLIGAVISMLLLIRRASRPHVAFLGRIPGSRRYSDLERHADNEPVSGVLIFRPEASLVYFNADHVRDTVLSRVRSAEPPVRHVIGDLSASPIVDIAGAAMIKELHKDLKAIGAQLHVVEARASVRDKLRAEGIEVEIGRIDRFTTVSDAVDAIHASQSPPPESPSTNARGGAPRD